MPGLTFVTPTTPAVGTQAPASWGDNVVNDLTFLNNPPLLICTQTTVQSPASGTWTPLILDTNIVDTYAGHSVSANQSQYFVPFAGTYRCKLKTSFVANATGVRGCAFGVGSISAPTPAYSQCRVVNLGAATGGDAFWTDDLVVPTSGYISALVYQNSGAGLATLTLLSEFTVELIHA